MTTTRPVPAPGGRRPAPAGARRIARAMSGRGLALFSETIVVRLAVAVLAIPAVTALPALDRWRSRADGSADTTDALDPAPTESEPSAEGQA